MNFRRLASTILFSTGLLSSVTTAGAQTVANGPYYATPSWDQTLPVASRYLVLANLNSDAVLDRETGLVWQRALSANFLSWIDAYNRCLNTKIGDRRGWRLPTASELLSLFAATTLAEPSLPAGNPFTGINPLQEVFWTSTPFSGASAPAHYLVNYIAAPSADFSEPLAGPADNSVRAHVLCVRSAVPTN